MKKRKKFVFLKTQKLFIFGGFYNSSHRVEKVDDKAHEDGHVEDGKTPGKHRPKEVSVLDSRRENGVKGEFRNSRAPGRGRKTGCVGDEDTEDESPPVGKLEVTESAYYEKGHRIGGEKFYNRPYRYQNYYLLIGA